MTMRILLGIVLCFFICGTVAAAEDGMMLEGFSAEEALRLGERMYRDGILPSGEPMQAIVMGDIPVDGRMFTCDDCHQRSGLGSVEGTVITWPTNGRDLYKPRRRTGAWHPPESEGAKQDARKNLPSYWQVEDVRPAYTDESLAMMLWTGVDPAGRQLDPIMPLYNLEDRDMAILIHYLKNLSVDLAPGVDEKTIRFATVVTDDVPKEDRQTMLSTLQVHIDVHNSQSRHQERRASSGPFYKTEKHQAYRRLELDVWELKGPENTWPAQLLAYYRKQPVFGLLGGITTGSWKPIHEFCEQQKIPSIFPLTELPVISNSDWYTLYFSKGVYQEGEATARYLHNIEKLAPNARVIQVLQRGQMSAALAQGFEDTWQKLGRPAPVRKMLGKDETLSKHILNEITGSKGPAVLLLWLETNSLAALESLETAQNRPGMVFASASLLGPDLAEIPDTARDTLFLTYSHDLPETQERSILAVKQWLKARKIPLTDLRMQSKIYFLGWMLAGAVKSMRSEFFRDYFLEGFDMMIDQDYAIAVYPRLTFGSGQRYASKGCYIVQLTKGPNPELIKKSDWVIH
jgi:hypothetical protein